jgi:hypothetical protein
VEKLVVVVSIKLFCVFPISLSLSLSIYLELLHAVEELVVLLGVQDWRVFQCVSNRQAHGENSTAEAS